jgi:hypothetical protein
MNKASKLLDKAGDVYSDSNAKEAGDNRPLEFKTL